MASTVNRPAPPRVTFSREELLAAADRLLPDVIAPGLDVLLCGINPGLWSAATGHHFARPGNRFWPALHRSGFTPRRLRPDEQHLLPGGEVLRAKVAELAPRWLAVLGVTAYRTAFGTRSAGVGPQERTLGATRPGAGGDGRERPRRAVVTRPGQSA